MKVCHITSAHSRYDVRIFEKECSSLADNGYDVSLIVNDDIEDEVKNGVKFVSTGFKPMGRRERMITSMKYILQKAKEVNADVYHLHDPELLQIVKKLKKNNVKVIFDAHEDTEVQIMDKEWIPKCFRLMIAKVYRMYLKQVLSKCDGIVTVTPATVKKMKNYNSNVEMVTNYPIMNLEEQERVESTEQYVFFAGGISRQWCHDKIIKAVSKVEGVRYKMAGPVEDDYLKELEGIEGWNQVEYLGKIPHHDVVNYYKGALAGMAVNSCSQIKGEGTLGNTKLFEVMAAEIPVICTDYRLWKMVVEGNQCGICVDSENVDAIAEAIKTIRDNRQLALEMGRKGKKAIEEQYNWKCEEKKLVGFYKELER